MLFSFYNRKQVNFLLLHTGTVILVMVKSADTRWLSLQMTRLPRATSQLIS